MKLGPGELQITYPDGSVQVVNCNGLTIEAQGRLAAAAAKRVEIRFSYDNGSTARYVGPVTVEEIEDTLSCKSEIHRDMLKSMGVHALDTYHPGRPKRTEAQWKTERRRFTR